MQRQAHVARKKNLARAGKEQAILVGGQDDRGRWWGRTQGQAPDIDGIVLLENCQADIGEIIPARMTGVDGYDMRATCLFETHTPNPVAPLAIDFIDTSL